MKQQISQPLQLHEIEEGTLYKDFDLFKLFAIIGSVNELWCECNVEDEDELDLINYSGTVLWRLKFEGCF